MAWGLRGSHHSRVHSGIGKKCLGYGPWNSRKKQSERASWCSQSFSSWTHVGDGDNNETCSWPSLQQNVRRKGEPVTLWSLKESPSSEVWFLSDFENMNASYLWAEHSFYPYTVFHFGTYRTEIIERHKRNHFYATQKQTNCLIRIHFFPQ